MSIPAVKVKKEKLRLDDAVHRIGPQELLMKKLAVRTFTPYIDGGVALEVGCHEGFMTERIAALVHGLDVVEGSKKWFDFVRRKNLKNVTCHNKLIEEFSTQRRYDYVFVTYVLTHFIDAQAVLRLIGTLLKPRGLLFVVVPNAHVLSRQLALYMGLMTDLYALTENDFTNGHRRKYDRVSLNKELETAGFDTIAQGGIMLKVLADFQMDRLYREKILEDQHVEGFYKLGFEYPDLCSAIYSIALIK